MESGLLGSYLFLCALVAVGVALLSYRYLGNQLWGKLVPQRLGVALLDERGNFWYRNAYLREEIERRHRYSLSAGLLNDPYLREFWRQLEGENQLGELPISIDGQVVPFWTEMIFPSRSSLVWIVVSLGATTTWLISA